MEEDFEHEEHHQRQAKHYASYIIAHANRGQDRHLFCGSHFRALSNLLSRSNEELHHRLPPFDYIISHNFGHPTSSSAGGNQCHSLERFDAAPSGLTSFASLTDPDPHTTRLVFVRGYPSADWVSAIGSRYRIDIAYFRDKLAFIEDKEYFDLPYLPSNLLNILKLNFVTIYKRQTPLTIAQLRKLRQSEKKAVSQHQRSQSTIGDSIIRNVLFIDETTFVIEQQVSVTVHSRRGRGRTAIIWLDSGRDLPDSKNAPWHEASNLQCRPISDPLPVILQVPSKSLATMAEPEQPCNSQTSYLLNDLPPSSAHLPHQYGCTLNPKLASQDISYALSELLQFGVCGETQFLNLIERRIMSLLDDFQGQEPLVLEELSYTTQLLQRHLRHISGVVSFLNSNSQRSIGISQWLQTAVTKDHSPQRSSDALHTEAILTENFTQLSTLVQSLLSQAKDGMHFVSSVVMLEESRQAISKADQLGRLTLLAFFFLPLSLTTSFFGSNFSELGGTGSLSIWVLFVTLFCVTAMSVVLCFWESVSTIDYRSMVCFWGG